MDTYTIRLQNALAEQHAILFDYDKKRLKSAYAEYLNCPVCDSDRTQLLFKKDYFTFSKCTQCSMVFLNPRLNDQATFEFYNSKWNKIYNEMKFDAQTLSTKMDDKANYENLLTINSLRNFHQRDTLLEIGSAKGFFLRKAREMGYSVYGVELNQKSYEATFREFGNTIYNQNLIDIHFPASRFDVIYMRDVFEHLPNPKMMLAELQRITKKNGIIFIEVPNIDGLVYRIVKEKHVVVFGFEHLNYWSPATLKKILGLSGFTVLKNIYQSDDFSLRYISNYFLTAQQSAVTQLKPLNPLFKIFLKSIRKIASLPPLRRIDESLLPRFANAVKRGSVIKVAAKKL